ncbi:MULTISPECIES: hypothetical protein [unclassified Streptomyces]|uniref:hypothetical protein n=1 Tax=unclassified Streptomyces TaxID=2593676 RepID=UPI0006C19C70|nr:MULTISPECIES: hypothetical protein [unclassified Streptomyces]KOV93206.1 hypothetical protein ADL02_11035 [Streptomyces sp. NRRL WC-3723]
MTVRSVRRLFAVSAAGVLLAGGAAIGTAGTASAATPHQVTTNHGCRGGFGFNNCYGNGFYNGYGFGNGFYGSGFVPGFGGGGVVVVVVN